MLLGFCFFLIFSFVGLYGQKKLTNYFTAWIISELEKKVAGEIDIGNLGFRFPNLLRLGEVKVKGKDFSFFAYRAILQWDWRYFFASSSEKAFNLLLEEVDISTSVTFPLDLSLLSSLPPGEIRIKKLKLSQFSGEEINLEKDREGKLSFEILLPSGKIKGVLKEKEALSFDFSLVQNDLPLEGEVYWNMKDNKVEGKTSSPRSLNFKSILSFTPEHIIFSSLELGSEEKTEPLFRGEGKMSNDFSSWEGKGEIWVGEEKYSLGIGINKNSSSSPFLGEFSIQGEEINVNSKVSFLEDGVLIFHIKPGATLKGVTIKEKIEATASWQGGKIEITIPTTTVELDMLSGLKGEGNLRGIINGEGREWGGHLTWEGQYLQMGDFSINDPQIDIEMEKDGKMVLQGEGGWGGGKITLSGKVLSEHLFLQGNFQRIEIKQLMQGTDFLLRGWVSGEWKREEDGLIFLSLQEGEVSWKDWQLGTIEKGEVEFSPDSLIIRDLSLQQKEGAISGDLEKREENWEGEIEIKNYPISYSGKEGNIELLLNGNVVAKDKDLFLSLFSSSWKIGEKEGQELSLVGKVEEGKLAIEDFSCDWGSGHLFLQGRVDPYQEVNLQGEIKNLEIPSYQGIKGDLEKVILSLSGPWKEVKFLLEGAGKNFFWQDEPWGDYFHLLLRGETSLPQRGEVLSLADYLDPRFLEEGIIEVKGINLESLLKETSPYPVSGTTDIVINLDTQKSLWFFQSRGLSFTMQDFNFQGEVEGSYNGKSLIVDKLHLQESTGGIEVEGELKWEERMLSGELKGKVDRSFSFPYGTLQLKGEANVALSSKEGKPYWQGEVRGEGEIWREGKKYAYFNGVQGTIKGYEIQLEKGNLHTAGLNWVVAGAISRETSEIRLSGEGTLDIPEKDNIGLSRMESNVVVKVSDGKINLQGEAKIFDGWGDFTKSDSAKAYSSLLPQLEEKLQNLPLSLELTLYTGNKMEIKTRFLDLGIEGKLVIGIEDGKISGEGKLEVVEGSYNLVGVEIPLTGYITFSPLYGLNPRINLYGEKEMESYHIFLEATGPVDSYKITLKSEPFLSEEEILSLLFLGEEDAYLSLNNLNWRPLLWKIGQLLLGDKFSPKGGFWDGIDIKFLSSENYGFYGVRWEQGIGKNCFIGYTQDLSGEKNSSWDFKINFDKEWSLKMEGDAAGEMNWMLEFNTKF